MVRDSYNFYALLNQFKSILSIHPSQYRDPNLSCHVNFPMRSLSTIDDPVMSNYFCFRNLLKSMIVASSLLGLNTWAAGGPPMITDDPGTPGDGHWEVNVATLMNRTSPVTGYQLPLVDANYGAGETIQLKIEAPWLIQHDEDGTQHAMGKSLAGVKWRFYDEGENGWQVSTYPQIEFATPYSSAAKKGLADKATNTLLPLEIVRAFEDVDVNVEVGRWIRPQQQNDSWIAGVVLTHEIHKGFEVMAELHDESTMHQSQSELIINVGARYDISENNTLLFAVGHDLHNSLAAPSSVMTYLGLQMRF